MKAIKNGLVTVIKFNRVALDLSVVGSKIVVTCSILPKGSASRVLGIEVA